MPYRDSHGFVPQPVVLPPKRSIIDELEYAARRAKLTYKQPKLAVVGRTVYDGLSMESFKAVRSSAVPREARIYENGELFFASSIETLKVVLNSNFKPDVILIS